MLFDHVRVFIIKFKIDVYKYEWCKVTYVKIILICKGKKVM